MSNLYHYTSMQGTLGVLSSGRLWATDVRFLNDSNEFEHALKFAKGFSREMFMDDDYLERFGWAVAYYIDHLYPENLFVTSFSQKPDLLSQWRGYCPAGGGVCMGFSEELIAEFCNRNKYRLEQCSYELDTQAHQVQSLIHEALKLFPIPPIARHEFEKLSTSDKVRVMDEYSSSLQKSPFLEKSRAAVNWLCGEMMELAPRFKDNGFHEEAEWRLIAKDPKEELRFRTSSNSTYLVPYVELEIFAQVTSRALVEIIVGPNPNQDRCVLSIRQLLIARGLKHVEVFKSSIPFNNW